MQLEKNNTLSICSMSGNSSEEIRSNKIVKFFLPYVVASKKKYTSSEADITQESTTTITH